MNFWTTITTIQKTNVLWENKCKMKMREKSGLLHNILSFVEIFYEQKSLHQYLYDLRVIEMHWCWNAILTEDWTDSGSVIAWDASIWASLLLSLSFWFNWDPKRQKYFTTYAYYHYTVSSNIKRDKELPRFVQLNRPPYYFSKAVVTIMKVYQKDMRTTWWFFLTAFTQWSRASSQLDPPPSRSAEVRVLAAATVSTAATVIKASITARWELCS